jgi:hypothetical protein
MNWQLLADHLASKHGNDYQSVARVKDAIRQIADAITQLGTMGHHYHLADGQPPSQVEWPKMMFHENCPDGQLVHGPEEQSELGEGWRTSLAEARQVHGLKMHFAGRGGVKLRDLPAVILGQNADGRVLTREERIWQARNALELHWALMEEENGKISK